MREIKFRAWNPENKSMVEFDNEKAANDIYIAKHLLTLMANKHELGENLLMQFTGLQDKSGVDIYEGDIVKAVSNKHYWLSVISADNGKNGNINLYAMEFCNNVTSCEFEEVYTYERQDSTRRNDINTRMEIIGNIHSNPELLEK